MGQIFIEHFGVILGAEDASMNKIDKILWPHEFIFNERRETTNKVSIYMLDNEIPEENNEPEKENRKSER